MRKPLIDVIFASEKRKRVLLLLQDEPQEMPRLLELLDTTRQALLPQMKILEEHHLVIHNRDKYELTTIGKLVVSQMAPLVSLIDVLDENIDYWGTHKIDFIPSRLLKRISELGKCKVISPSLAETYDMNIDFKEASRKSQSVYRVSTYFNSEFSELFSELLQNNVNVYFIASRELFNKLRMDNNVEFVKLINNGFFHFYVYPKEMDFMSFAYNDYYLILRLIKSNGEIDTKYVLSCNPDVVKWGKEIFDNYLKDSVTIDKSQLLFAEAVEVI